MAFIPRSFGSSSSFIDVFADPSDPEDGGFEVFDPRGLFSPRSAHAALPPPFEAASTHGDGACRGTEGPDARESRRGTPAAAAGNGLSSRALLPALQIPGTESRDDEAIGYAERYPARPEEPTAELPGLARSGSNECLSPLDSAPGTPASFQALVASSAIGPSVQFGSPSKPRGRTELRRFIFDAQHATSSPSPSSGPFARDSSSASLSASYVRGSSSGRRRSKARQRPERSPDAISVGSDAYSDMMVSPAVSFLSAFAESTNDSMAMPRRESMDLGEDDDGSEEAGEGDQVAGYKLGPVIGRGSFSIVREATRLSDGTKLAVKIVPQQQPDFASSFLSLSPPSSPPPGWQTHDGAPAFRDRSFSTPAAFALRMSHGASYSHAQHAPQALAHPSACATPTPVDFLAREIAVWSQLAAHPNVLPMVDLHRTPTRTYIFMPLCVGGNLLQLLNEYGARSGRRRYTDPTCPAKAAAAAAATAASASAPALGLSTGLDLPHARHIFAQIVRGLEYLHLEAHVTHKDLKLENILVHEGVFRIADFGLADARSPTGVDVPRAAARPDNGGGANGDDEEGADEGEDSDGADVVLGPLSASGKPSLPRIREAAWAGHESAEVAAAAAEVLPMRRAGVAEWCGSRRAGTASEGFPSFAQVMPPPAPSYDAAAGSLPYTPPEQLDSMRLILDPSVDVWALGCILYALLEGQLPFTDDFEPRLRMKILRGQWEMPSVLKKEVGESRMAKAVLRGCLDSDPTSRWTIVQVAGSEWLAGEGENRGRGRTRSRPAFRLGSQKRAGGDGAVGFDPSSSPSASRSRSKGRGGGGRGGSKQRRLSEGGAPGAMTPVAVVMGGGSGPPSRGDSRGRSTDRRIAGGVDRRASLSPSHSRSLSRRRGGSR